MNRSAEGALGGGSGESQGLQYSDREGRCEAELRPKNAVKEVNETDHFFAELYNCSTAIMKLRARLLRGASLFRSVPDPQHLLFCTTRVR
jgi:hypothetical protein